MSNRWQLQQAKARLSEVVNLAIKKGPQVITRHGKDAVVVMSAKEYVRRDADDVPLGEFFHNSPLRGLKIERSRDIPRPTPTFD